MEREYRQNPWYKPGSCWGKIMALMLAVALIVSAAPFFPSLNCQAGAIDELSASAVQPVLLVSGADIIAGGYTKDNISNEKSYTLEELIRNPSVKESVYYSTQNNSGFRRIYLGDGISVGGLLARSGLTLTAESVISMTDDKGNGVSFDAARPLAGRYYFPNIGSGSTADSEPVEAILAWANKYEENGSVTNPVATPVIPDKTAAVGKTDLMTLMVGQQTVDEINNPLFYRGVSRLTAGEALTEQVITIGSASYTRSEILMMERADRSYSYSTKGGEKTDYARGVPLATLLQDYDSDDVVSFTAADDFAVDASGLTVGELAASNYLLAYEKGASEADLTGIYETVEGNSSIKGYFTLYGDGAKPSKLIDSLIIAPTGCPDYSDSPYKHINNGGRTGSAPYNIDAITGATLTVEGPGVEATTPIRMGDLEATDDNNIYRGLYTDIRGGSAAVRNYEGVKVLSIIDGLVNSTVEKVDENIRVIFKNRWRQDVGSINYDDLKNAATPVILAYGTGTADETKIAPFVYDGDTGVVEGLGNEDGCVKLVYDKAALPNISQHPNFISVAYVYVERGGEPPGFKHSEASDEAYRNPANMQQLITFTGSKLGYEVNYTAAELEAMVEYDVNGLPAAEGLGHRAEYGLSNTTYWYVNEYEGVKLWDLLTSKMGLSKDYASDENTMVSFAAWDNYQTTARFSTAQLADPDRFYFYEKSPLDIGSGRPTKEELATPEYQPNNKLGVWTADSNGYPVKKGYPVMLAYGVNSYPYVRDSRLDGYAGGLGNDGGPIRVIFGKADGMNRSNPAAMDNYAYFYNNGSNQLQRAQEIYVGDNKRYSTHMENPDYAGMADTQALTVEIVQGGATTTKNYTLAGLESILYGAGVAKSEMEKQGRQEKGYYAHKVNDGKLLEDLFEGVNIWYLLSEDIGMQGVLGTISLYSEDDNDSALDISLPDIQSKGYNSIRGTEGLGIMVAFAKNGYPLVLDKNSAGYIKTNVPTGKTIKNDGGPLMFVRAQSAAEKEAGIPGATVTNLTKIVVNLDADIYAHASGDFAQYGDNTVSFTGAVKSEGVILKVSDIEKLQKYMVTDNYTVGGVENVYRGINLNKLLASPDVGASALLSKVTVTNGKDSKDVTVGDMSGAQKSIILAYGIGKEGAEPAGKPLVPNNTNSGYDAGYGNDGGPLRLIIDGASAADCIENVTGIAVMAAELTGWTHSTGYYESYKDNILGISGSNISKARKFTVAELEALSETYKVLDRYKLGNEYYFEGIDLLKLLRDYIGFSGDLTSSNITVVAKDNYSIGFTATDLTNGVNGKPIIIAYGQGTAADTGLPLVDGDDTTDIRDGFDPNIGNAFGPLRLVVNDNTGWCNKWVTSIVVGSGSLEPPAKVDFILTNGSKVTNYDIRTIKSITAGSGGKATASYDFTSNDVKKTEYVKGVYLADLLSAAGVSGDQVRVTINTTDGFEISPKASSYRDITLTDLTGKNYFLAYDAGESADTLAAIADKDKDNVEATVRIYRNYDDGDTWSNRMTNIKGITVSGADTNYTFKLYEGTGAAGELPMASVRDVITDAVGGMWVGTNGGGAWYKPAAADEFTINTITSEGYVLQSDLVYAVAIDSEGGVWFTQSKTYNPAQANLNKGVAYLKNGVITYYNTDVSGTIPNNYVQEVQIDAGGSVWFGSFGGLTKYCPSAGTWTSWDQTYKDKDGDSFPALSVDNLTFDGQGGVWLGFYPNGTGTEADPFVGGFAHMTAEGDITPYQFTAEYDGVLGSSLLARVWVRDIAVDENGGAWVVASGSYADLANVGGTVWYVDSSGTATQFTGRQLLGADSLTGNSEIRMAAVDANGGLWFGTSADGLFYIAGPGVAAPLAVSAQYSGKNGAWPDTAQFNNIYVMNIIGDTMYLGSDAGVMMAAVEYIAVGGGEPPAVIESFTISGVGAEDIDYYVGGAHDRTFKGLAESAGKVEGSYSYNGETHSVKGALLKDLLADAGAASDIKVAIKTSDNYTKDSYQNIPYADIVSQNYFVAYDVGEGTGTLSKIADKDNNGVTASYRIYRNLDAGAAGDKDNRIKGVTGIVVSKASGGGGELPGDYDLIINGKGVKSTAQFTIKELQSAPRIEVKSAGYDWLNNYGTRGSDAFKGVYLQNLLEDVVGLTADAKSIKVTAGDGYYRSFNLDNKDLGVYWTDIQGNQLMLAWERNGSPIDLQLIVGQIDVDHVNKPMWVSDVKTITVNASSTSSGSGTPGSYEGTAKPDAGAPEPVQVTATVSGNTASFSISNSDIGSVLNKMREATPDPTMLEIDAVSGTPGGLQQTEVTLSAQAIATLAGENNLALLVTTGQGAIVLPAEVLKMLAAGSQEPVKIIIADAGETAALEGDRPAVDIAIMVGNQNISDLGGNQIQVNVPYEAGSTENGNSLLVYYINQNGDSVPVRLSIYDAENDCMVFDTMHLSLYAVGYNSVSFNDIPRHWAKDSIEFLAAREIIKGRSAGYYEPDGNVTRAEFVTILANSTDGITVAGNGNIDFTDVAAGDWYAPYINWAAAGGIVSGYGDGRFGPDDLITREQIAVMTDNFIKTIGVDLKDVQEQRAFTDEAQISGWAAAAVGKMQQRGIISGRPDGAFAPQANATRAEAATLIKGYLAGRLGK